MSARRTHYTYCPKCLYFIDTCDCDEQPFGHYGIEHDNCEHPTNAWPKAVEGPGDCSKCGGLDGQHILRDCPSRTV